MNTEAAEVPKFRQESPESPGSPVSDYQNVSGNADGDKPLNAKAHMSAIQDYIDQAKSELIHLHREKGELSTEIIRATDHVERELRGVASVLEIGVESKAKMLKMKMKTQKEDSSVFDPQLNGITNDNLQMQKLIDICNAKLERLEKKVGSYKGE